MIHRRKYISACSTIPVYLAGCLDILSDPEATSRSGIAARDEIFVGKDIEWKEDAFAADIFDNTDEFSSHINEDSLVRPLNDRYTDFNADDTFVSVFASRLKLHSIGTTKGWCPEVEIEGDTLLFKVPLDTWPDELNERYENMVVIDRWTRNRSDPPKHTKIDILQEESNDVGRTC
ncbi:hypothetical protein ACLI4Y_12210 [Natrialbaceae archaeon A-CW3]